MNKQLSNQETLIQRLVIRRGVLGAQAWKKSCSTERLSRPLWYVNDDSNQSWLGAHLLSYLLFQQIELYGMHAAASIVIFTRGSLFLFRAAGGLGAAGRMLRRPDRTMTDGNEVGRKYSQQQQRLILYGPE